MLPYDVCTCLHKRSFEPSRKCFHNFPHIALVDFGPEVEHTDSVARTNSGGNGYQTLHCVA
jgi:hypothetical protein